MAGDEVSRVSAIEDRMLRLRAATEALSTTQGTMTELARIRRALIQELHSEGWSYAKIAGAAGLTRGRIHQVRHQGPKPEGAFFGTGPLRIATPLKREEGQARPVVAAEDVTASQRLGALCGALGFDVDYEQIPLTGEFNLNRDGLIVICGPRISPDIAQLLNTDPAIRFTEPPNAWALREIESGTAHRSGQDRKPPTPYDVAYLGRLRRPDGEGTVLVFTGIHPPGTLGVVELLSKDLLDLHQRTTDGLFSVLVGVEYDPDTHEPGDARLITPVYMHKR